MLVFLILHSLVYIIQYGSSVLKLVIPFRALKQARLSFTLLLTLTTAGAGWAFMTTSSQTPLQVHRLSSETLIEINGKPDESFCNDIPYVSVKTTGDANFENGATTVSIKAAANEYETYFLFRWKDETKSLAHLP
jgi:hypothetical protein